jgi:hypothetical protein
MIKSLCTSGEFLMRAYSSNRMEVRRRMLLLLGGLNLRFRHLHEYGTRALGTRHPTPASCQLYAMR